jgi:hypothetical protein
MTAISFYLWHINLWHIAGQAEPNPKSGTAKLFLDGVIVRGNEGSITLWMITKDVLSERRRNRSAA